MSLVVHKSGQGQPLVLLHGWGMHSGIWQQLLPLLERDYAVYAIDLPGHGKSRSAVTTECVDDWVTQLVAVVPEQAIWLGWSLGGLLSLCVALRQPQSVQAVLLLTTSPRFIRTGDWPVGMVEDTLNDFADALLADPARTLKRFLALQLRGVAQERELLRQLNAAADALPAPQSAALLHGLQLLRELDLRAELAALSMPSAWLFGDKDTLVAAGTAKAIDALLPQAQVTVLAGAAHAPALSHPAAVLHALQQLTTSVA